VRSELTTGNPDPAKAAAYGGLPILQAEDVADAVVYALSTPEDVQVNKDIYHKVYSNFCRNSCR
jgi:NADP-dependent 3-hydroxy acid dehydrogenase YdfG